MHISLSFWFVFGCRDSRAREMYMVRLGLLSHFLFLSLSFFGSFSGVEALMYVFLSGMKDSGFRV